MISGVLALKASANGFRLADQDAFATARGEAFVATADNPSAIYYNPAGITQLEGNNLRGGLYGIYLDPSYSPPAAPQPAATLTTVQDNLAAVPQIFYTYTPTNMPVSFGLGVYAPYGGNMSWPQDTGFRTVATGRLADLFDDQSGGGGEAAAIAFHWRRRDGELCEHGYGTRPSYQFQLPLTNFFRFTGDGWSVGYNLGLLWQPHEKISLGATFRSSATVTLDGHTEFEQQPIRHIQATHRSAQADFEFPLTVVFGISYRPTPKWNMEFDADYTDWSSFGTNTIHQGEPPAARDAKPFR